MPIVNVKVPAKLDRDITARADKTIDTLDWGAIDVRPDRDILILVEGYANPRVLPPEHATMALMVLGGPDLLSAVGHMMADPIPVGLLTLVVVGKWCKVGWIGLVPMAKGGEA